MQVGDRDTACCLLLMMEVWSVKFLYCSNFLSEVLPQIRKKYSKNDIVGKRQEKQGANSTS